MANTQQADARGVRYFPLTARHAAGPGQRVSTGRPMALYLHIPFCEKRCHFCEFAVVAGTRAKESLADGYVASVKQEMRQFLSDQSHRPRIALIQFGGGTPTSLRADQLEDLLAFIFAEFDCAGLEEVIIEGFPGSITQDHFTLMGSIPGLKLNIGVQSFQHDCLESVGREHGMQARSAIRQAVASKIASVGIDIIFGLPNSTPDTLRQDLELAAGLGVDHFALYPLWVYDQTALAGRIQQGRAALPGPAERRSQFAAGLGMLELLGFGRYTAFHHALTEASRHRYGLWQMQARDWVGFGMSAMSYLGGDLFVNDRAIQGYMARVAAGDRSPGGQFATSERERMAFALLYGIRLRDYPLASFAATFGVPPGAVFGRELRDLEARGLLVNRTDSLSLTVDGILNLDQVENAINRAASPPPAELVSQAGQAELAAAVGSLV